MNRKRERCVYVKLGLPCGAVLWRREAKEVVASASLNSPLLCSYCVNEDILTVAQEICTFIPKHRVKIGSYYTLT